MEQSEFLDPTLAIYERLRAAGHDNVGTVLQAYLYRTPADLTRLLPLEPNLRIVKGAYLEPAEIAYPGKKDVDRAYVEIVERGMRSVPTSRSQPDEVISVGYRRSSSGRTSPATASSSDALRRPSGSATLDRSRGYKVLVATHSARTGTLPHAQARRAPCKPRVLRAQPGAQVSSLPRRADVVVVGGGAIGTSIAFHLAEANVDVCLLERDALSSGSTSRAAGGVRTQFSDPLNVAIGLRGIEAFAHTRPGGSRLPTGRLSLPAGLPETSRRSSATSLSRTKPSERLVDANEAARLAPRGSRRRARGDVLSARRAREPQAVTQGTQLARVDTVQPC
jgi:hypothetical protein